MVRSAEAEAAFQLLEPPQHITQAALAVLDAQVGEAVLQKAGGVGIDLSRVQSIDSAGLNWLLSAQTRLAGHGIHMMLHNPSPVCMDILVATRLDQRFKLAGIEGSEPHHA